MTAPQRHDWKKLIAEIAATGITPYKLSLMAGIDKKTMQAYAEGKGEPKHSVGEWIIATHAELVPPTEPTGALQGEAQCSD